MMARVVFDARTLATARSGIGRFLEGLLIALKARAPEHEYRLVSDRPLRPEVGLDGEILMPWLPKQLWEGVALPRYASRVGADVLHLPQEGFVGANRRVRRIVTINDLIPLHFAERYMRNRAHAAWYRMRLDAVRRHADVVLTISEATARELEAKLGIARSRIRVVRIPVDSRFHLVEGAAEFVRRRFDLRPADFFLAVGSADPRKNTARVLEAHARYARAVPRPKLLILFGHIWRGVPLDEILAAHGAPGLVRVVGGVTDAELVALYNLACAMIFPSTYEGYGLPVTEAMACGCPVVTSHDGALAEVAGTAALLVDPYSVPQLAAAIEELDTDPSRRERMRTEGLRWARREDWADAAASVLEAYDLS